MSKLFLILSTIKYLKPIQIYYRLFYFVRNRFFKKSYSKKLSGNIIPLVWDDIIFSNHSYTKNKIFKFLNINQEFKSNIDWNYNCYGKLWVYNLNYFDFLNQKEMSSKEGIGLILNYIESDETLLDGKEPYPISLRGVNWIKFLSKYKVKNHLINQVLYNHYQILLKNLEYHLLGNHLLENGFSLLFGAYFFKDDIFYNKAIKIIYKELNEEVLEDGAHFELSPMYHQIILFRLLECIHLLNNNFWKNDELLIFLISKASMMLGWLDLVTFSDGSIPMVNDSAHGIAPNSKELFKYAEVLNLSYKTNTLGDSGYRKYNSEFYELFLDVGDIGPSYQSGHAHSDTFNFVLYVKGFPFIVDRGISTYESNSLRQIERGTKSHNTVEVHEIDQSEVWCGFRVGNRAKIISIAESDNSIKSTHNGYKKYDVFHSREWVMKSSSIVIKDTFNGENKLNKKAFFHLHPSVIKCSILGTKVLINDIEILFNGDIVSIEKKNYKYASGFNKQEDAILLEISFYKLLETQINI
mgnify:CR=1 FL=1